METEKADSRENPPRKCGKVCILCQICIRVCVIAASLASALITFRSKEVVSVFGIQFVAEYPSTATSKLFAFANVFVCVHAAVSLLCAFLFCIKGGSPKYYFLLFLTDLATTVVALVASSAAAVEGYLGKHGNSNAGSIPLCQFVHKYCETILISIILSFCSVFLLLLLTVMSACQSRPGIGY